MKISPRLKKTILVLFVIGLIAGAWTTWYVFFKPHRDAGSEKPEFSLTADALTQTFSDNPDAVTTYIDKAILLEGTVSEVGTSSITMGNIVCNFEVGKTDQLSGIKVGQTIKIQGRVTTYNDLLDEIALDMCSIK
jgi:PKD repeat protein